MTSLLLVLGLISSLQTTSLLISACCFDDRKCHRSHFLAPTDFDTRLVSHASRNRAIYVLVIIKKKLIGNRTLQIDRFLKSTNTGIRVS